MKAAAAVAAALGVLLLIAAIVFGGWEAGWWFRQQNVNREYQVNRDSSGYQQSLISAERDRASAWDVATDPGQKTNLRAQFCTVYPDLTAPPNDITLAAARLGC